MEIPLIVRDLDPGELTELAWTGGADHQLAIARDLEASYAGLLDQLVVALPNGRLVAFGEVDFRSGDHVGLIMMLSVHEVLWSLGIGTVLLRGLERRILDRGRVIAELGVEHDNPRAAALYRRLGYAEVGSRLESWSVGDRDRYVTVCTVLRRRLGEPGAGSAPG